MILAPCIKNTCRIILDPCSLDSRAYRRDLAPLLGSSYFSRFGTFDIWACKEFERLDTLAIYFFHSALYSTTLLERLLSGPFVKSDYACIKYLRLLIVVSTSCFCNNDALSFLEFEAYLVYSLYN